MGTIGTSMVSNGNKTSLNIIVVGAGIAGLATATALLNGKHHHVTVLECHPSLNEFGASIGILPQGVRCLRSLGLADEFAKVVTRNKHLKFRNGLTNEVMGHLPHNAGKWSGTGYGEEVWNINQEDYQNVLADAARVHGIVFCSDGTTYSADVIVGADGLKSAVRKSIPRLSHVEPIAWATETCYRCTVPKSRMVENDLLQPLLNHEKEMAWMAPGRYVLSWPLPPHRPYDVVLSIVEPGDVPLGKWGHSVDPKEATKRFDDFCPQIKELLSHVDRAIKWTLGELPALATCKSENGRAVVLGDAFHGMLPHSASGGNSAIEDAVSIAECLDRAWHEHVVTGKDIFELIGRSTQAFENVRKTRVEQMQIASDEGYDFLAGTDADFVPIRDKILADQTKVYDIELEIPEEERRARPKAEPDMNARFPTEPYLQWLYGYDSVAVTKEYLSRLS